MDSILVFATAKPIPRLLRNGCLPRAAGGIRLRQLARREWWLWFSALFVATLSALALALSHSPLYSGTASISTKSVLIRLVGNPLPASLFNGGCSTVNVVPTAAQAVEWAERRRGHAPGQISDPSGIDPVTGLHTRAFIEQQLGKEIARARRQNTALSMATIHLDQFAEISKRYDQSALDSALKELARRLKKACRGSDFAARLASDDFLLVLPNVTWEKSRQS